MSARADPIRDAQHKYNYVRDRADLPDKIKFDSTLPCQRLHPGFCKQQWTDELRRAHDAFLAFASAWPCGVFISVNTIYAATGERSCYLCLGPKAAETFVVAKCDVVREHLVLRFQEKIGFSYMCSPRVLYELFYMGPAPLEKMTLARLAEPDVANLGLASPSLLWGPSTCSPSLSEQHLFPIGAAFPIGAVS